MPVVFLVGEGGFVPCFFRGKAYTLLGGVQGERKK